MATIRQRNKTFCLIYDYVDENGQNKQKWESFKTLSEAKARKKEVEYKVMTGNFVVTKCTNLNELLDEFINLYGKEKWAISTYSNSVALAKHYIRPQLGHMKIADINTRTLELYYQTLLKTKAVPNNARHPKEKLLTTHHIREVHKMLRCCFNQAIKWGLLEKNPAEFATVPKEKSAKREIWTSEILFEALKVCEDPRLSLALNLAFCCSLRIGEMLGLTWDCVDITAESIQLGVASIRVTKELSRLSKKAVETLDSKDIQFVFPSSARNSTVQVLKAPKTESSVRKIFMPKAVAKMLCTWKQAQDEDKRKLGDEYIDYGLVFAGPFGMPIGTDVINSSLQRLIKEHDLPKVVFHSFRHASVTYKLKLNGGDIKSVQGDTGHSQASMVTEVYSHILDDGRKNNAQLFQQTFYDNNGGTNTPTMPGGLTPDKLEKLLAKPEIAALLASLAGSV